MNELNQDQQSNTTHSATLSPSENVSAREKQILEQLVKGKSNKEIAKALQISSNTVRNQLQ